MLSKYNEALESINKAIEIDNNNMDYYLLRTAVNFVLDDFKSVLQDSEKILEQNPNSVDVLEYRGFALRKVGKYSDALLLLNKLVEMNALNKTAILYRGLCYEDLDLPQKALQDYQMVLKLDPSDSTAQKLIELLQKKM
jgi:tetratricopeptide (TPR) repeat protein